MRLYAAERLGSMGWTTFQWGKSVETPWEEIGSATQMLLTGTLRKTQPTTLQ